ncbi:MAG: hypothetical protein WA776_10615 [Xanthobacteraceae bacterium]
MIEVNGLIEQLRVGAKNDFAEATMVTGNLASLLREKLDLHYKIKILDRASPKSSSEVRAAPASQ